MSFSHILMRNLLHYRVRPAQYRLYSWVRPTRLEPDTSPVSRDRAANGQTTISTCSTATGTSAGLFGAMLLRVQPIQKINDSPAIKRDRKAGESRWQAARLRCTHLYPLAFTVDS